MLKIYALECLRKKHVFVTFRVWLCEKQHDLPRWILHSPKCCCYVKSHFVFIWSRGIMCLPRSSLLMRNGRIKIDIKTLDGLESRKLCEWFCTCFFLFYVFWHVQIMKNQVFCHNFPCVNVCEIRICHLLHIFVRYTIYHFLDWKPESYFFYWQE